MPNHESEAQMAARRSPKPQAEGSTPSRLANLFVDLLSDLKAEIEGSLPNLPRGCRFDRAGLRTKQYAGLLARLIAMERRYRDLSGLFPEGGAD